MKKTKRYLFLLVALLMALVVRAYKIEGVNATFGSIPVITYGSGPTPVTVNATDIPSGQTVTMTVTPNDGYYLSSLVYEEVTDLGWALAPRRRTPNIQTIHTIPIPTTTYAVAHFGGTYTFNMPENNVIITATFVACTSIDGGKVYWDSWDGTSALPQSKVYDGTAHTMKVRVGDTELTKDRHYTTTAYTLTNVDNITPTITGIGEYNGSISGTTTLSITQQPLTITAQAQTITYGSSIQTGISKVTVTGLVTDDALTSITLTPSTSEVTDAGTITPSAATTTKGIGNYAATYHTGLLIINPENLSAIDLSNEVLDITLDNEYFNYSAGNPQKATVTSITYQGTLLEHGASYTYDYAKLGEYTGSIGSGNEANPEHPVDYIASDIYTIVITFCGNYTGTKRINYQIRPEITLNDVNGHRWRTFYEPLYNMEVVTDKFEACTVESITINSVTSGSREVIKAGTPMLLYRKTGTAAGIYPPLIKKNDSRLNSWSGVSSQYICNVNGDGTPIAWDLDSDGNITGGTTKIMILVDDKFVRTKSGTLAAGKCYLDVSSYSSLAREFFIDDEGEITEIEEVEAKKEEDEYYDLSGRRVLYPTRGIYIMNGKKVIIK